MQWKSNETKLLFLGEMNFALFVFIIEAKYSACEEIENLNNLRTLLEF